MGFSGRVQPWNLRYQDRSPVGLARCKTVDDIRVCLQWAQQQKAPIVARSGGHSYAGYSTTKGLMIDLSDLDSFQADSSGIVKVGAGARNATLYKELPRLKRSVTHGRCENVGVGGLVLGGGVGFNMRLHGVLVDQLIGTELMTADGRVHNCTAGENPDLLWACQGGGGGNFGINTSFTFESFPVGKVTVFNFRWEDGMDVLFPVALDLLPGLPNAFGCKLWLVNSQEHGFSMNLLGQYHGPEDELRKLLAPLLRRGVPDKADIKYADYWDVQKSFLGEAGTPEFSHERSRYVFNPLSAAGAAFILRQMRAWPQTSAQASWKAFHTGGAIAERGKRETAYWHRDAIILSSIELNWHEHDAPQQVAESEAWLARFHDEAAEVYASHQSYQNFIDDSQANHLRAYYGGNLERLVEVKRRTDPGNVFNYRQGIPLNL